MGTETIAIRCAVKLPWRINGKPQTAAYYEDGTADADPSPCLLWSDAIDSHPAKDYVDNLGGHWEQFLIWADGRKVGHKVAVVRHDSDQSGDGGYSCYWGNPTIAAEQWERLVKDYLADTTTSNKCVECGQADDGGDPSTFVCEDCGRCDMCVGQPCNCEDNHCAECCDKAEAHGPEDETGLPMNGKRPRCSCGEKLTSDKYGPECRDCWRKATRIGHRNG